MGRRSRTFSSGKEGPTRRGFRPDRIILRDTPASGLGVSCVAKCDGSRVTVAIMASVSAGVLSPVSAGPLGRSAELTTSPTLEPSPDVRILAAWPRLTPCSLRMRRPTSCVSAGVGCTAVPPRVSYRPSGLAVGRGLRCVSAATTSPRYSTRPGPPRRPRCLRSALTPARSRPRQRSPRRPPARSRRKPTTTRKKSVQPCWKWRSKTGAARAPCRG